MSLRCSVASLERGEDALGTASTVRAFLLVENAGPWGVDALRDARMPEPVRASLQVAGRHGVRVLLVRRHRGALPEEGVRVFAAWADPHGPWLETALLPDQDALLGLDLAALGAGRSPGLTRTDRPVLAVCTHGRHDSCCAELGRPTATALAYTHPEETWEVSHVGGDRFAANVLVLPEGLYYGRVSAAAAPDLAARHLGGHLDLHLLRGRSGFGFAVQVAEVAARRAAGETRVGACRLVSQAVEGELTRVRLAVAGTAYDVVVRRTTTEQAHQLTCRAARPTPATGHVVESVLAAGDEE